MNAITKAEGDKLALIRRTVAKDCNDDEFRLFIHMCNAVRLDPLRRQAHAFVFSKKDEEKRQLTVVTSIGGYRSIADRTGNYRPDTEAPRYTMCAEDEKTNPEGIESCDVTVFKFSHGEWWPVVGQAFWKEYVPLYNGMLDRAKQGWIKMPRIMIAKCAEANALRKAWPDDFANVHAEEETHREESLDAITAIEQAEQADRFAKLGGPNLLIIDWMDGKPLAMVPAGQFKDRAEEYLRTCKGQPSTVCAWAERNAVSLRQFWGISSGDALALKKDIEKSIAQQVEDELQTDLEDAIAAAGGRK